MDKAEIDKILELTTDLEDKIIDKGHLVKLLTSLIIKWLEGKKKKLDYSKTDFVNCNSDAIYGYNQLITELIGEVRDEKR